MIQQLTIFMENKKGSLIGITEILKEADINIISLRYPTQKTLDY